MKKNITNVTSTIIQGVAVVNFTIDCHERYFKAYHSSTRPEDLLRDVKQHLDYWNRLDPSKLDEYGEGV